MTALSASEELGGTLIYTSSLDHPPICFSIIAFWALDLGLRKGLQVSLLLPDDNDLILLLVVPGNNNLPLHLLFGTTLRAYIDLFFNVQFKHCSALRAEFH